MEKRAIVYSFYKKPHQNINLSHHYDEMRYSIDTLRLHNKDIPVYVYMSPEGIFDGVTHDIRTKHNVHVRYFDNTFKNPHLWTDKIFVEKEHWHVLFHRWKNAIDCALRDDIDCVLFIDSDTIFYKDPNAIFDNHNDRNAIWAKPDNSRDLIELFSLGLAMNDGQFLLSKAVAQRLVENFEVEQSKCVNHLLKLKDDKNLKNKQWTSIQFGTYLLCRNKGIPIKYFNQNQVMTGAEPDRLGKENLILHHYFSMDIARYLPKEYKDRQK